MKLTVRVFGHEVLHLSTDDKPDDKDDWRGDIATGPPIGFTPPSETPLREPGRDLT